MSQSRFPEKEVTVTKRQIHVYGYTFEMMIYEEEGYFSDYRTYDLFFKNKRIAKDISGLKLCYLEASEYVKQKVRR